VTQPAKQWPSWKLAPPIDKDTQGLVVAGFGHLETGRALFLEIRGPETPEPRGAWLRALKEVAPVTSAVPPDNPNVQPRAAALAFTWTGLKRMGLPETALASFSRPFREGMFQEDRLRRLGDRRRGKWLETVVEDGPRWSANTPPSELTDQRVGAYDVPYGEPEEFISTPITVHAILLLYARTQPEADDWAAEVEAVLNPHGIAVVHRRRLVLDVEQAGFSREHFGFADALSQPAPYDEKGHVTLEGQEVREPHPVQGVPLGEFLIGYVNGHHEKAPGPVAPGDSQDRPAQAGLLPHEEAQGFYDLGLNGSYMVVRELKQHVAAFWNSMDRNAKAIQERDPENSAHVTPDWLAERVVGRDRDGHLLCPGGKLKPDKLGYPDNDFLFLKKEGKYPYDPHGIGCPPGSHVRRAFPRDALAPSEEEGANLLAAANNHRILRRGRKFGPTIKNLREDDGEDRGLLFICLNTDIARQFEFIQQTWLFNPDFATLFEEVDPLVGPDGRMTIREEPLRRTVHVETFVQMAGGDYFFLPSLPALRYLELL